MEGVEGMEGVEVERGGVGENRSTTSPCCCLF